MANIRVTVSRELIEWFREQFKKDVIIYNLTDGQIANKAMVIAKAHMTGEEQEYEI